MVAEPARSLAKDLVGDDATHDGRDQGDVVKGEPGGGGLVATTGGSYDHFTWQRSVDEKLDTILVLLNKAFVKVGRDTSRGKVTNVVKDEASDNGDDRPW